MGGDYNCTLNPNIDRNGSLDPSHNQSRKVILNFMDELGLCDVWRERNPDKREFSCHSATHKTYSRLDFFLVSRDSLSYVKRRYYNSIVISDHATVSIEYCTSKEFRGPPRWRFDTKWLQDPEFISFINQQIEFFFQVNTSETSPLVRWEAFKAYIRGQIISYTSFKSKQFKNKMLEIENEIKLLENEITSHNKTPALQHKLATLRAHYNELSANKALTNLNKLRQSFYDQGEKAGKLLAWRIKTLQNEKCIHEIEKSNGIKAASSDDRAQAPPPRHD